MSAPHPGRAYNGYSTLDRPPREGPGLLVQVRRGDGRGPAVRRRRRGLRLRRQRPRQRRHVPGMERPALRRRAGGGRPRANTDHPAAGPRLQRRARGRQSLRRRHGVAPRAQPPPPPLRFFGEGHLQIWPRTPRGSTARGRTARASSNGRPSKLLPRRTWAGIPRSRMGAAIRHGWPISSRGSTSATSPPSKSRCTWTPSAATAAPSGCCQAPT